VFSVNLYIKKHKSNTLKSEKVKLENVRVIEIVGLDEQMDAGTHVKNTKEIGKIVLSSYESKGKHNKRAKITLY